MKADTYSKAMKIIQRHSDVTLFTEEVLSQVDEEPNLCSELEQVWTCYNRNIKDVADACNTSVRQVGIRFIIPERTYESWGQAPEKKSHREPSKYLLMMLQECLGLMPEIEM